MNLLEAALRRTVADLAKYDRRWALVGGFAVSARAEPRFTHDIDAAVAVADDADSEGLVRLMLADGYRLLASVEQDETGRLATVRLASPLSGEDVVVDLLFASSGIEPEIARAAEMTWNGLRTWRICAPWERLRPPLITRPRTRRYC